MERAHQRAGLGVLQRGLIAVRHDVGGEIAEIAAAEPRRRIGGLGHGQTFERGARGQQLLVGLGVGLGRGDDLAGAEFLGRPARLLEVGIEAADGVVVDRLLHRGLDQHVAHDPFPGRGQPALGHGALIELAFLGLGGQQLLVNDSVQHLAEQVRRGVQRLALADQALGDGFAFDVRRPHRAVTHLGHSLVAGLGGLFGHELVTRERSRRQQGGWAQGAILTLDINRPAKRVPRSLLTPCAEIRGNPLRPLP